MPFPHIRAPLFPCDTLLHSGGKGSGDLIWQVLVNPYCRFSFGRVFLLWCWKWNLEPCACLASTLYLGPAFVLVNLRGTASVCGLNSTKEIFLMQCSLNEERPKDSNDACGVCLHILKWLSLKIKMKRRNTMIKLL